ncbi:MAG: hypothetical protein GEU73_14160 [Chloroflexi bacterium]|nr:hypothetical protein [Chloroflexota bacterium]
MNTRMEFPDGDPEQIAWNLIWSVREDLPDSEVLRAEDVSWSNVPQVDALFKDRIQPVRSFSHTRIRYRDECHNPCQIVDCWVPSILMPLDALRRGDALDALAWLEKSNSREAIPHHAAESVTLRIPGEEDRLLLELNLGIEVFLLSRLYYSEAHEPLMLRETLLTTDHYLDYNIHLEWERRIKEGLL